MESQLVGIYIRAVQQIAHHRNLMPHEIHIFFSTEDSRAVAEFTTLALKPWTIHVDQFFYDMLPHRNNITQAVAGFVKGWLDKTGLWALGSLLVAIEADSYVLSTGSNWSRCDVLTCFRLSAWEARSHSHSHSINLV
jgi:hypothetical protein